MRENAQPFANSTIDGQARVEMPYIAVNFRWLIGPVLLWVSATVLLCATIWLSDKNAVPLWKHSTLALVKSQYTDGASASSSALSAAVGGLTVRTVRQGNAWRFESVD
jgi:hypothetical protein